jgi:hypothetical protein
MGRFIILNVIKSKEELNSTEPSTSFRIPWKKNIKNIIPFNCLNYGQAEVKFLKHFSLLRELPPIKLDRFVLDNHFLPSIILIMNLAADYTSDQFSSGLT